MSTNSHVGSSFDDFLLEEGIDEDVELLAAKKVVSLGLQEHMHENRITKTEMAALLQTSRSQLDRVLDPKNTSVTLVTMQRAVSVIGRKLRISVA